MLLLKRILNFNTCLDTGTTDLTEDVQYIIWC